MRDRPGIEGAHPQQKRAAEREEHHRPRALADTIVVLKHDAEQQGDDEPIERPAVALQGGQDALLILIGCEILEFGVIAEKSDECE